MLSGVLKYTGSVNMALIVWIISGLFSMVSEINLVCKRKRNAGLVNPSFSSSVLTELCSTFECAAHLLQLRYELDNDRFLLCLSGRCLLLQVCLTCYFIIRSQKIFCLVFLASWEQWSRNRALVRMTKKKRFPLILLRFILLIRLRLHHDDLRTVFCIYSLVDWMHDRSTLFSSHCCSHVQCL